MSLVETSRRLPEGFVRVCAASHACPSSGSFPSTGCARPVEAAWPHEGRWGSSAPRFRLESLPGAGAGILDRGGTVSPPPARGPRRRGDRGDPRAERTSHRGAGAGVRRRPLCARGWGRAWRTETFFSAAEVLARSGIVSFKLYSCSAFGGAGGGRGWRDRPVPRDLPGARSRGGAAGSGQWASVTRSLPLRPEAVTRCSGLRYSGGGTEGAGEGVGTRRPRPVPNRAGLRFRPPGNAVVRGTSGLSDRRVAAGLRTARPGKLHAPRPGWPGRWRRLSSGRRAPGNFSPGR